MKKIGVAVLGLGVVGGGVYKVLTEHREFYRTTQELDLSVESVLEPRRERIKELGIPEEKVAANVAEAVFNPDVQAVVECIGGAEIARNYVLAALKAGKTVVTSNKELICKYSHELERAAKAHNAGLYYEASCVGGVPVIRTLLDGVQSNEIACIMGIINGTTNYILTAMTERGISYEEALEEARTLGYAEADPTADIEGFDAAYKLSILASLAFHTKVPFAKIFREGIGKVTAEDISDGDPLGYRLKLLAIGKRTHAGIEVRVHPAFIKKEHPLAGVGGNFNAVFVEGDPAGEVMLLGKGAGELPTASAIVSDLIFAATHGEHRYSPYKNTATPDKSVVFCDDFSCAYFMRLTVSDEPGILSKIAAILGRCGVSIVELSQTRRQDGKAKLVLVTHKTHERAVKGAVAKLGATDFASVESVIRVVS